MNIFIAIGRITKDIEVRTTPNGTQVASFDLAITRDKDNTDFIKCVAYSKTCEILSQYTEKGSQIGIEGRLQTRNYEDKKGQRVYVTEIVVSRVELLGTKKAEEPKERYDKSVTLMNTNHNVEEDDISDNLPF